MEAQDAASHKRPRNEETPPPTPADSDGVDRLSHLREGLLHHVLSLLPAHEAVRTCVLSRPWRHLWKSAPGLLITAIKGFRSADKLDRFVTCLLLLHRSSQGDARLESCEFSLCEMDFDFDGFLPDSAPNLCSWIESALVHQVKVLRVTLVGFEDNLDDFELPYERLVSHHLTTLDFTYVDTNDEVLDFSGCPALLDLSMSCCNVNASRISSQSLKHLSMLYCEFDDTTPRTRMSLPSLVSLELFENSGRAPLLDSMPALETATVAFEYCCTDKCADRMGQFDACGNRTCEGCYYNEEPVDDHNDCLLLKGLSQATELILAADDTEVYVFMRDLKWCPTFSNLITLELGEWCFADGGLDALILFLWHSPILEELILHLPPPYKESEKSGEAENSYNPVEQSVASHLLQMVEIKCKVTNSGMVLRILKTLKASGVPSDKIVIQCDRYNFACTDFSSD